MLKLRQIRKSYPLGPIEVEILKGLDLNVERGELAAIIGQSGSGKSTLMNIIGLLDLPTSGTYELNGLDVLMADDDKLSRIRGREIGFVFQQYFLLPRLSARDNVSLPLVYRNLSEREIADRALHFLAKVGMADRADHLPRQLSGGQQQRVAIARALAGQPSLILADEPTGNLDSKTSVEIMGVFQKLNAQGITVVMVTHELDIAHYCKRNLIMRDGRLVSDTPVVDRLVATEQMQRIVTAETDAKLIA
jgi:putative ABC transport system ATP-binding protein